jgi:hypothetical protein
MMFERNGELTQFERECLYELASLRTTAWTLTGVVICTVIVAVVGAWLGW